MMKSRNPRTPRNQERVNENVVDRDGDIAKAASSLSFSLF